MPNISFNIKVTVATGSIQFQLFHKISTYLESLLKNLLWKNAVLPNRSL